MPNRTLAAAIAALALCLSAGAGETPAQPITQKQFPSVAKRVAFFEQRINSPDAAIRKRALSEAGYFFMAPDREYTAFLQRMSNDPDPAVAGRAVRKLHSLFVPIDVEQLPARLAGYHDGMILDLTDKAATIASLLSACKAGGAGKAGAGWAAYSLGLLKHQPAAAALKALATDKNIFNRYSAGRALLDLGEHDAARDILREVAESQLARFEKLAKDPNPGAGTGWPHRPSAWYAALACRALMELGRAERKQGLAGLVRLMGYLERSEDINDQSGIHSVRLFLANVTGQWLPHHADAKRFYDRWQNKADGAESSS